MIKANNEQQPYKTKFTNGTVISYSDVALNKGGSGDGFRPHELLESALACCVNMSIRMYADKKSLQLKTISTTVNLDRSQPNEVCFDYNVKLDGNLSESERNDILEVARNCPVRKTLSSRITFKMEP